MTSDRARFEAELAERGMWLEKDCQGEPVTIYVVKRRTTAGVEIVTTGSTWRQVVSTALDRPAF